MLFPQKGLFRTPRLEELLLHMSSIHQALKHLRDGAIHTVIWEERKGSVPDLGAARENFLKVVCE